VSNRFVKPHVTVIVTDGGLSNRTSMRQMVNEYVYFLTTLDSACKGCVSPGGCESCYMPSADLTLFLTEPMTMFFYRLYGEVLRPRDVTMEAVCDSALPRVLQTEADAQSGGNVVDRTVVHFPLAAR
jgi:hypothetical protein